MISGRIAEATATGIRLDVPGGGSFVATGRQDAPGTPVDMAVRTDRVRIGETAEAGLGFTGLVANVEYRGATVKIVVAGAGIDDFTIILADSEFFAQPITVGQALPLHWSAADAIVLGRLDG